ncbi:MAG: Heme A synthase [Candidatus Omnitrophica bacterium]|nr:Heme A synthase [Candidatus Omnitrophota bacterium]
MNPAQRLTHLFAVALTLGTLMLIAAGGLVTSTESGLSVPDWPLSYGQFFPPMVGGVRFEHSHRMIAGAIGVLTLVLAALVHRSEQRRWIRALSLAACVLVLVQAVLGGLTVIHLLPLAISVTHACVAQSFLCVIASIALTTSNEWRVSSPTPVTGASALGRLELITLFFVFAQLVAGALLRHRPNSRPDAHIILGALIVLHALLVWIKTVRVPHWTKLRVHGAMLVTLVLGQVALGIASLVLTRSASRIEGLPSTAEVLTTTAHQTLGAAILMTMVLLYLRSRRFYREAPAA